jgi:hypothetical protein
MAPSERRSADAQAVRHLVTRLAVVAVQGEQLKALCEELEPLLCQLRREPQFAPAARIFAGTLETVAGVARDIADVTEAIGRSLQQTRQRAPHEEKR